MRPDMVMTTTTDKLTSAALYRLLNWLSPNFPVGAFAFSHGLEYAVEAGAVRDAEQLAQWLSGIVTFGAGRVDSGLLRAAWQAAGDGDDAALARSVERADALRGSAEMALESSAQGQAFLDGLTKAWPHPGLLSWNAALGRAGRRPAYASAVGVAAALAAIPLRPTLLAYLNAFAANLVSATVRLVPLGQTDGQRVMATMEPIITAAVEAALARDADDLGSAALIVDWTSMQHETQYTRLFRS